MAYIVPIGELNVFGTGTILEILPMRTQSEPVAIFRVVSATIGRFEIHRKLECRIASSRKRLRKWIEPKEAGS